jgi:hypothetical protein
VASLQIEEIEGLIGVDDEAKIDEAKILEMVKDDLEARDYVVCTAEI